MITIEVGRPSELVRNLRILNPMNVRHLRVRTYSHFWHTDDRLEDVISAIGDLRNLEHLDFVGDSHPNLLDLVNFLSFLQSRSCTLKTLNMPVSPPFPGQYRIQDRTFMTNKLLYLIHNCRSITSTTFRFKNSPNGDREDEWVLGLNAKVRSLLRNRGNREEKSHL
jgi:hypothetical protein